MDTAVRAETGAAVKSQGRFKTWATKTRNKVSMAFGAVAVALFVPATGASATTEEAVGDAFSEVQSLWLTTIVPAVIALTLAILGIVLAVKWIRKTAKSS